MSADDQEMKNIAPFIEEISVRLAVNSKRFAARAHYEAEHSPPDTPFNKHVAQRIQQARQLWEPTLDANWWTTAGPKDIRDAYIAAAELSELDDDASRAAAAIRNRYVR